MQIWKNNQILMKFSVIAVSAVLLANLVESINIVNGQFNVGNGDLNTVTGNENIYTGNSNTIVGNLNKLKGNLNNIKGDDNFSQREYERSLGK